MFDDVDLQVKERYEDPSYYVGKCADCDNVVMLVLGDRCSNHDAQFRTYLEAEFWEVLAQEMIRLEAHDIADCRWIGAQ